MSLLIVPLLYPDLAGLLNFSQPFQHNFRVADYPFRIGAIAAGPKLLGCRFYLRNLQHRELCRCGRHTAGGAPDENGLGADTTVWLGKPIGLCNGASQTINSIASAAQSPGLRVARAKRELLPMPA